MNAEIDVTGVVIETERLILREWNLNDLDDFFEYASVPDVGERAGWPHHKNKEESLGILRRFIDGKKTFAIVYKENNKVIGSLGVEYYGAEDKLSEFFNYKGRSIGYVLSKDYWGRGLVPEALRAVINYLFNTLDYDFLLCGHFDFNIRSRRVQEKCGFVPYRRVNFGTKLGREEPGVLSLLVNPKKNIKFEFSHPETLIYYTWNKYGRMNLKLITLTKEYEKELGEMIDEWKNDIEDNDTNRSPWAIFKNDYHDFDYYLENLEIKEEKDGKVPDSTFFLLNLDNNRLLGAVNIRHYLNEKLLKDGGHIGDGIRPSERRKGYATEMIRLALLECKKLGIKKVLMVCDKDNIGSMKSIVNNGGVLENEITDEDGNVEQRYWISLE